MLHADRNTACNCKPSQEPCSRPFPAPSKPGNSHMQSPRFRTRATPTENLGFACFGLGLHVRVLEPQEVHLLYGRSLSGRDQCLASAAELRLIHELRFCRHSLQKHASVDLKEFKNDDSNFAFGETRRTAATTALRTGSRDNAATCKSPTAQSAGNYAPATFS